MRRGGERSSLGKPAPTRPRRRSRTARAARGRARARRLDCGRRPRPGARRASGFADRRCILSTEDEPAIERLVGALEIDGIISPGTDWPVGVAARVARARRAAAPDLARRRRCSRRTSSASASGSRRRACRSRARGSSAAATSCPRSTAPVVVKAPDRQGQKGLTLVADPAELPAAIETARGAARNGLALVEELVDGPEVTVVGFSVGGVFTALAVTDRLTAEPPAFGVALAHVWPSARARHRAWPRSRARGRGARDRERAVVHAAARRPRRAEGDRGRGAARRRPRRRARRGRDRAST